LADAARFEKALLERDLGDLRAVQIMSETHSAMPLEWAVAACGRGSNG
jgi:hypothetical protein